LPYGNTFLSDDDVPLFNAPGRRVPRTVRRVSEADARPEPLLQAVLDHVKQMPKLTQRRFRCCCIAVEADDGMSWSAEAIAERCAEEAPQYTLWRVQDAPESSQLPAIAAIIGEKRFVNAAAKRKFTSKFLSVSSRPWMSPLVGSLLFVVPAIVETLKQIKPGQPLAVGTFSEPLLWVYGGLMSTLGLLGKWAADKRQTGSESKNVTELRQRLQDERANPEHKAFVQDLLQRLKKGAFPRILIIDNWQALDHTTRAVLEAYLQSDSSQDDAELWVVFEKEAHQLDVWIALHASEQSRISQAVSYDQLPLTTQQKRDLVKCTLGKESAIESTSVKFVCRDWTAKIESLVSIFKEWRGQHPPQPEGYGDLEFLYFLSLTATPGDLYFRPGALSSRLNSLRPTVAGKALHRFFNNSYLDAEEFESRCESLKKHPPAVVKAGDDAESLRVTPEAAAALAQTADALALAQPALGHLFWCFFWEGVWHAEEMEPFWMRKIILHLLDAKAGGLKIENDIKTARHELLRINLFAIDKALPTCLFTYELPLFRRVLRLLRDSPMAFADRQLAIQKAWECFAVFGDSVPESDWMDSRRKRDDDLAATIGELSGDLGPLAVKNPQRHEMLELFLDSIPASQLHAQVQESCFSFFGTPGGRSASDYAICRAAWLTLTLVPMVWGQKGADFGHLQQRSVELLEQLFEPLMTRLQGTQSASSRSCDLVSLSIALWCEGLIISFEPLGFETSTQKSTRLIQLALRARQAISLAREIRQSGSTLVSSEDLFSRSLAREVSAVALASVLTACHYLEKQWSHEFSEHAIQAIAGTFSQAAEVLATPWPGIASKADLLSPKLARKVGDLMRLSILIWRRLGLSQLHDLLSLRQVHFSTVSMELALESGPAIRGLMESMSPVGEREDFIGLMANCILADCLKSHGDLPAELLIKAGSIAMSSRFGNRLQQFLAFVIVQQAHAFDHDLRPYLELLVERNPDGSCFLRDYLRDLPRPQICGIALRFLNACRRANEKRLQAEVEGALLEAGGAILEGENREEFEALMDWSRLKTEIQDGAPVDTDECLARWAKRKHLWLYASVLHALASAGHFPNAIQAEAIAQLRGHSNFSAYNSYYLLALDLMDRAGDLGSDLPFVVDFVKRSLPLWEAASRADTNAQVYKQLRWFDPENSATHSLSLAKWQEILYQREHLQRLRKLYEEGQHFLVFKQYFLWMADWGLMTDLEPAAFWEKWNRGNPEKMRVVESWSAAGGSVPNPFTNSPSGMRVSSDFLLLGSALFELPFDEKSQDPHVNARKLFNEASASYRRNLIQLFSTLPQVPQGTAQLLSAHSERLYHFSDPANPRANATWTAA
jgi:hypothetical protein